jgi:hypothetical protein
MVVASSVSLCFLGVCATTALGATYNVDTTTDTTGTCSPAPASCTLRQAIDTVNATPSPPDVINVVAGHYVLSNGTLDITENMTINGAGEGTGAGATTIDGNGNQVFSVSGADPSSVTFTRMNIQGSAGQDNSGGGIGFVPANTATLTISHVVFTGNSTDDVDGGAIFFRNDGSAGAALNITDSTISGNTLTCCGNGAGVAFENGGAGTLTITGSTISGNSTNDTGTGGGGVYFDGATLTSTNSTFSGNTAAQGAGLYLVNGAATLTNDTIADNSLNPAGASGAGIFGAVRVTATNTIVSDNTGAGSASTDDCDAAVAGSDHSLENGTGCGFDLTGNPTLAPLGSNGGPTQTMALGEGSAAIDAGDVAQCPMTDQRGSARPDVPGTACDVGAYESGGAGAPAASGAGAPTASITTPASGATFTMGQVVHASYSCAAGTGATLKPGSAGCAGPVANGAAINTSTVGAHSFTVTATDTDGQTGSATNQYTVVSAAAKALAPVNIVPPSVSGTPKSGHRLSCSTGTWTNGPTNFSYQWSRERTPISGAINSTYKVRIRDDGLTLTCTVTASNAAGAGKPATSKGVSVRVPSVPGCPPATGALGGKKLGRLKLGVTRSQAHHAYSHSSDRRKRFEDFFCLTPIGVRVGYASPKLLNTVPSGERKRLRGRVVWASTSNARYAIHGIRPGATLATARRHLKLGRPLHIGLNFWYLASNGSSTAVLKVRHGIVEEIGIADKQLTKGRKAQRTFMKSFF